MSPLTRASEIIRAYAAATAELRRELPRALIRTKSSSGREVLAALASDLRMSAAELEEAGRAYRRGSTPGAGLDPRRTLDYARVAALQTGDAADQDAALGLLLWVLDEHPGLIGRQEGNLLLQLAVKARDFALGDRVLETVPVSGLVGRVAAADLANPWIRPDVDDEARWVEALNTGLFGPDVVQAALLPDGPTPFDRLTTASDRRIQDGRKITVVISCYNPDRHLITAVRSVVEQTWQNFELFVVDDASPAPTPGVLDEVERMDPRITVIRKAVNGGTYRARNTALRVATGDFFTSLDSDDWAHPQRLELGVRPMLEDEALVATRSLGLRATEQMEVSRVGYGGRFKAASSLMIRTFPVVNRIGFFDPVRKAADNEYAMRVEAAFDGKVVDVSGHALTILLADAASLSAADYSPGWRHPARSEYVESYREWHRRVLCREAAMFLPPHGPRAFPAPRRWERNPQDGPPGPALDVVIVADWRDGWVEPTLLTRLEEAARSPRRVGVVHLESLVEPVEDERPIAGAVREALDRGAVERVYLDDARRARLTVVADPRVLQFPPVVDVRLSTDRLVVLTDAGAEAAGEYAREDVGAHARAMLGADAQWLDEWPAPPPEQERQAPAVGAGTVDLTDADGLVATGDLTVEGWPLREPADAERGALLSLVRRSGAPDDVPEVRELGDAWAVPDEPWEDVAVRWLGRARDVWAVAVTTTTQTRLVVTAGVRAESPDPGVARLTSEPGAPVSLLVWQGGEFLQRPVAAPVPVGAPLATAGGA